MTDNMDLWNAVCTTDPAATKHVAQRGGFTAIDAYSQIMAATERFGPVGEGWGWIIEEFQYPPNDTMVVHLNLWHLGSEARGFSVCGQAHLYTLGKEPKPDADCAKKAVTDAITKGLSYLGFNADVFLGKFDDNKYVGELEKNRRKADDQAAKQVGKYLDKNKSTETDLPRNEQEWNQWGTIFKTVIDGCKESGEVDAALKAAEDRLTACKKASTAMHEYLLDYAQGRREILETPTRDTPNTELGAG